MVVDKRLLRIAAAVSGEVPGFSPHKWGHVADENFLTVLITDDTQRFLARYVPPEARAAVETEHVAAAVMRSLMPQTSLVFPRIISRVPLEISISSPAGGTADPGEVHLSNELPGRITDFQGWEHSPNLCASLADFLATLHTSDPGIIADAGLVVYDSSQCHDQLLADFDRGAQTGLIPSSLLNRWEHALENRSLWRFLAAPVHGNLGEGAIYSENEKIVAVTDLTRLRVGDPAHDIAALATVLSPEAFAIFLQHYEQYRGTDCHSVRTRSEVLAEMATLEWLLAAYDTKNEAELAEAQRLLEDLAGLLDEAALDETDYSSEYAISTVDTEPIGRRDPRHA